MIKRKEVTWLESLSLTDGDTRVISVILDRNLTLKGVVKKAGKHVSILQEYYYYGANVYGVTRGWSDVSFLGGKKKKKKISKKSKKMRKKARKLKSKLRSEQ